MKNKRFGNRGEQIAADYLTDRGIKIIGRNIRTNYGEIDIIGEENEVLLFIEVKTRRSNEYGYPEEAVNYKKREHMENSALEYIQLNEDADTDWRIDVIAINVGKNKEVKVRWFKNALAG